MPCFPRSQRHLITCRLFPVAAAVVVLARCGQWLARGSVARRALSLLPRRLASRGRHRRGRGYRSSDQAGVEVHSVVGSDQSGARWVRLGLDRVSPDAAPPMWRPPLLPRGHAPLARGLGPDDDRLIWLTTLDRARTPACVADPFTGKSRYAENVHGTGAQQGVSAQQNQQPGRSARSRRDRIVTAQAQPRRGEREASEDRLSPFRPRRAAHRCRPAGCPTDRPARKRRSNLERLPDDAPAYGTPAEARAATFEVPAFASVDDCSRLRQSALHCAVLQRPGFRPSLPRTSPTDGLHARALVHRPASRIAARRSAGVVVSN